METPISFPSNARHGSTLGERQDGWSRCVRIAMWEFPKAMKYAGCNGRANSLNLTTYVQRKGLFFTGQAAHLPCKYCLHMYSPMALFYVTPLHYATLESLSKPKSHSNFGTVSLFLFFFCCTVNHCAIHQIGANHQTQVLNFQDNLAVMDLFIH